MIASRTPAVGDADAVQLLERLQERLACLRGRTEALLMQRREVREKRKRMQKIAACLRALDCDIA